jgi:hypothetical protein
MIAGDRSFMGRGIVVDEIPLGRGALLKRLRGPDANVRGIPWESVIELGERIVVRIRALRPPGAQPSAACGK